MAIRRYGIEFLADYLVHQGMVSEAAAYVIPILFRLIEVPETEDKYELLSIIGAVADIAIGAKRNTVTSENDLIWAENNLQAVRNGYGILSSLLVNDKSELVIGSMKILALYGLFGSHTEQIIDTLRQNALHHPDITVRIAAIEELGQFILLSDGLVDPQIPLWDKLQEPQQPESVRFEAAYTSVRILTTRTPDSTIKQLVEAALATNTSQEKHRYILYALWELDDQRSIKAYSSILKYSTDPEKARETAKFLLDKVIRGVKSYRVFPIPANDHQGRKHLVYPKSTGAFDALTLTEIQKEALQLVLDNEAIWQIPNNLFEIYGLPASLEQVQMLLKY